MAPQDTTTAERAVTIYALCDPRDGAVRYIGRTVKDPTARLAEHMSVGDGRNGKTQWLAELRRQGLKPSITVLARTTRHDAPACEQACITDHLAAGAPLLNTRHTPRSGQRLPRTGDGDVRLELRVAPDLYEALVTAADQQERSLNRMAILPLRRVLTQMGT